MSMTTPRFNFFDKEILKDAERDGKNFEKFKEVDISCSSAGRGQIVLGEREGTVFTLDKHLNVTAFRAHTESLSHIQQLRQHNVLFTVGRDTDFEVPVCKVWLLDRVDSHGTPHCARIIKLSDTGGKDTLTLYPRPQEVTCMSAHENMQLLAIGFKSGAVVLYKGDVTKDRQSRMSVLHDSNNGTDPISVEITGLAFRVVPKSQILFISTKRSLLAYEISVKDKNVILLKENFGCAARCCALSDDILDNQFLIGRNDGVYYVRPDGRGGTAPLEGEKYQVHWYRGYLVTVGRSNINREMDIVTIYDTLNKFIAYSGPIPRVSNVLFEWNTIYVLGADNKLYMLLEKATQTKLDILFKKNQYSIAINIAKSQQYDTHGLVDIFRLYGDYLYTERGDHDRAIDQYIKTIGKLEPSYVIRKFLDAQRLHNLTKYLEELHHKHYATEDHTTLLLNCYTKLKDQDKLDGFIQKRNVNNEVNFDIETAIRVLRQADYHSHALQLADRHGKHEWYMKIQLENIKDFAAALQYMQNLPFTEAENSLKKYGKVLVQALPSETTSLLKRLCLGQYSPTERARPDEFIHIFVNNSTQLTEFLEAMISSVEQPPSSVVYNTLLELYLQNWAKQTSQSEKAAEEEKAMSLLKNSSHYAKDQALVLCHMQKFRPGILYLYEQGRLYQQIVRHYMEYSDYDRVISSCKKWGDIDSHLWVMALSYFANREDDDFKLQMKEVLRNIDEQKLLPPLLVIQTLANSKVCTLGVVKDFIMDRLLTENDHIEKEEKMIKQYIDETQTLRHKIEDLQTKPQVFQVSRCSVCKYHLELPSIHFLCQHSYHTHCFESYAENENECPACLEDNRKVLETIKEHERTKNSDLTKSFISELKESRDGFDVVAEYFGKGVFNKVSLVSQPISAREDADDPYLTSPASAKVASRRNPFSSEGGVADTLPGAGSFRRTTSTTADDSDFPLDKQTSKPAVYRQTMPAGVTPQTRPASALSQARPASALSQAKPAYQRASQRPYDDDISAGFSDMSNIDVISTRPKQRATNASLPASSQQTASRTKATNSSVQPSNTQRDGNQAIPSISVSSARPSSQAISPGAVSKAPSGGAKLGASPTQSLAPARKSGHTRQSSAGKIIESGLSFIKGHTRRSSDQSSKKPGASSPAPSNPFTESARSSGVSRSPASANPFESRASSNPFGGSFEEAAVSSNPFEADDSSTAEASSNPFIDLPPSGSNPFEEENKNPFE